MSCVLVCVLTCFIYIKPMEPIKSLVRSGRRIAQVACSASGLSSKAQPQAAAHVDGDGFVLANSQFTHGACSATHLACAICSLRCTI